MMKKVLACLLCVLMTMGMLAGCGKGEDQSQNSKPAESGAGDSGTPGEEPYKARMIIALPAA
ncbi:MAG: hypothetical protein K2G28_00260, partial [Acetatifactor sp.]|nr:hypothetical protein [Acetatifactor sp.]